MGRKKKTSNRYWTKITECAIQAYNQLDESPVKREKIYRRFLFTPLMKMAENRINQMKPDYIDKTFIDLQTDLVTYLTERLPKIKTAKGKGFSYFTRTSWNYLIAENSAEYKKLKRKTTEIDLDEDRNIMSEIHNLEMRDNIKQFMDTYIKYCYNNLNYIFSNSSDIHVADCILHFFEDRINIEEYNKKSLYILIRERAGLDPSKTNNLTRVMKVLKRIYEEKFEEYKESEFVKLPF
jgi:hypothetical protein